MKEYWAAKKKAQAAKPAPEKKGKLSPAGAKVQTKSEEEKKALSQKMKEAWKKRKAAAAKA